MTRRRWIADEVSGNRAAITGDHAAHLARVLRARVGQEFDISANNVIHRGRIIAIGDERVEFELGAETPAATSANMTLLLAIFKFDRMEWAIEKCTELGVSQIVPIIARRTDSHLAPASTKRVERWRRIAMQASEQSRRRAPPEISAPVKLSDALAHFGGAGAPLLSLRSLQGQGGNPSPFGLRIVLSEAEDQIVLRDVLASNPATAITLAIGPEGGWSEDELKSFEAAGWISASLGPTILRAETAAIAAAAIVLSHRPPSGNSDTAVCAIRRDRSIQI